MEMDVRRIRMSLENLGRRRGVRILSREMGGEEEEEEEGEGEEEDGWKGDRQKKTIDLLIPFNIIRRDFRINSFSGALTGRHILLTR